MHFSPFDNSDPRFNGRTYRLRLKEFGEETQITSVKPNEIQRELGNCYVVNFMLERGFGHFELWEDDRILGPGGCMHDEIRETGQGRYSVWGEQIYFSTSDNSDPRVNRRTYTFRRGKIAETATASPRAVDVSTLEGAIGHLARNSAHRDNFVAGRIVHVGGSLGAGGAERQIFYTLARLGKVPFESAQLLCYYLSAGGTERHDFYLPAFNKAQIPVRTIRQLVSHNELQAMPLPLREVAHALPPALAADIANLYWEFSELGPEIVHAWLDGNNVRAGLAAALAGVPRIFLSGRNLNPTRFDL